MPCAKLFTEIAEKCMQNEVTVMFDYVNHVFLGPFRVSISKVADTSFHSLELRRLPVHADP